MRQHGLVNSWNEPQEVKVDRAGFEGCGFGMVGAILSWGKERRCHCAHRGRAHGARHALYRDQSERPSQQVSLRENLLRPWSGRKLHQELETPFRLRSHIMLEGQRQPDAANDPPLRLPADVDAANRLPEMFAVAASPVRHTPHTSDKDRSNCRREENTDHHVATRVMSTSKPDPLPVRSTRTTSSCMIRISRTIHPEPQPTNTKSHHNVRRKTVGGCGTMRGFQSKTWNFRAKWIPS